MEYLIITKSENKHYLLMTEGKEGEHRIRGYKTKEDVMEAFEPYTKGWTGTYERSMSCTIGMMNMQPVAIEAPVIEDRLVPYIKEMKVYHIRGGALGRGYYGIPVTEDILQLKQFDVWEESMKMAGIILNT